MQSTAPSSSSNLAVTTWELCRAAQLQGPGCTAFPANAAALNASISASPIFDTVADPPHSITPDMYWDGGPHLWPAGYQIVANLVI